MGRRFFYDTEFIERPGHLDLISIAFVPEDDGETFYAVNADCDFSQANEWVRENVLPKLPPAGPQWRTRDEIASCVIDYLRPSNGDKVELWGYYSAYDHVALCWLFGPMVDLPPGMPMYTRDVKQLCDALGNPRLPASSANAHDALADATWTREAWRFLQ